MYGQCNSFSGEVVSPDLFDDPEKLKSFDLTAILGRNSKEIRQPEIFACAKSAQAGAWLQEARRHRFLLRCMGRPSSSCERYTPTSAPLTRNAE
jgi:hypothetical protein